MGMMLQIEGWDEHMRDGCCDDENDDEIGIVSGAEKVDGDG